MKNKIKESTNIEFFDWFIMIVALMVTIMFFLHSASERSFEGAINNVVVYTLLNMGILFVVFIILIMVISESLNIYLFS